MIAYSLNLKIRNTKSFITFKNPKSVKRYIKVEYFFRNGNWYKVDLTYVNVRKMTHYMRIPNFDKELFEEKIDRSAYRL